MALQFIGLALLAYLVYSFLHTAVSLYMNIVRARKTGLPLFIRYISPNNVFWIIFGDFLIAKFEWFPLMTSHFRRFYVQAWDMNERYRVHAELGDAFISVAPSELRLYLCDHDTCLEVLRRPHEFRRDIKKMKILNIYGSNIITTDGREWRKFRKATASTFTENAHNLAWQKALVQAEGMLSYWTLPEKKQVRSTLVDCKTASLNVVAGTAFSQTYAFEGQDPADQSGTQSNVNACMYRDSLSVILRQIFLILIFGERTLRWPCLPMKWQSAGNAVGNFRNYVNQLIDQERTAIKNGQEQSHSLIPKLVRLCEAEKSKLHDQTLASTGTVQAIDSVLSEDEIVSSVFVYTIGATDTTASTLAHSIAFLAANPHVQDWVSEEIQHWLPDGNTESWPYQTYPKLKRCMAVMYETLRLNNPVGKLLKISTCQPHTLTIDSRPVSIPPNTTVVLNVAALQTHPKYWGDDAMTWNPSRWITRAATDDLESETLQSDARAGFLAWAHGQRACPGKKFSQVEFVALFAKLFHGHRVEPVVESGESIVDARARTARLAREVAFRLVHEIRQPARVGLRWRTC